MSSSNRDILIHWLEEAQKMKSGEELNLPCETKEEHKDLFKNMKKELQILGKINPVVAGRLILGKRFKDSRFWVFLKKTSFSPLVAFKKGTDGKVERISCPLQKEKLRRLSFMAEDGLSLSEVEEIEGKLTESELTYWKQAVKTRRKF